MRVGLRLAGFGGVGWGGWLLLGRPQDLVAVLVWILGGIVWHDLLAAQVTERWCRLAERDVHPRPHAWFGWWLGWSALGWLLLPAALAATVGGVMDRRLEVVPVILAALAGTAGVATVTLWGRRDRLAAPDHHLGRRTDG